MKCLLTIGLIALWNFASAQVLLWDNGDWDGSSNFSSERDTSIQGLESWVVDDSMYASAVRVNAFYWDAILAGDFEPTGVDVIIMSEGFDKLFEFSDLPFTREFRGTDRGQPVYLMKAQGFVAELPAGRYYMGGRIVGGGQGRGFSELRSREQQGVTEGFFRAPYFGYSDWTRLSEVFGSPKELAFKVYGEVVPEPGVMIGLLFGVAFCAIRRARAG